MADLVLGLMNPYKMDMETCLGYSISDKSSDYQFRDRFRLLKIIKSRLSRDNINIGLLFHAEAGYFEEVPPPKELSPDYKARVNKLVTNR